MNSDKPTLYDRLGGVYAIATVVDDFIDREAEWTAFCKDFDDTMAKLAFPTPKRTNSLPSYKVRRVTSSPANNVPLAPCLLLALFGHPMRTDDVRYRG
jgi:hypothetical protein